MKKGFTFKGRHTDEFGITVKTQDRPIIPAVKTKTYSAAFMDGEYDFSAVNPFNREMYDNRTFQLVMQIHGDNLADLHYQLSRIASWLCGSGDLIFDDTRCVKWAARCETAVSFAPELRGKKAILTVQMRVSPFGDLIWSTARNVLIGYDIPIGTNIPLGLESYYTYTKAVPTGNYKKLAFSINIPNFGDRPILPIITFETPSGVAVYGKKTSEGIPCQITISNTDNSDNEIIISDFGYGTAGGGISVDFETQEATTTDGTFATIEGEFFELSGDHPTLDVTLYTVNQKPQAVNMTIKVDFVPKVVWDLNVDDFDWGDFNA